MKLTETQQVRHNTTELCGKVEKKEENALKKFKTLWVAVKIAFNQLEQI